MNLTIENHRQMQAEIARLTRELEQANRAAAHHSALFDREKATHASTYQLYHRYFVAQQQTQKGLNRLVRKCKRQKETIERLNEIITQKGIK